MKYDVVIIGAGPAGLFAAYELINSNKKLNILLIDRGYKVKKRVCPMNKKGVPCQNCNPCAILSGYGGAGTFSDGKLNFIPKLGKSDLTKYMLESEANQLIDETENLILKLERKLLLLELDFFLLSKNIWEVIIFLVIFKVFVII